MDNNPVANTTPVVPDPVANIVQQPPTPSGNNKMWLIVVAILVLILVVGGLYWYMNQQKAAQTAQVEPSPSASTVAQTADSLEQDLNSAPLDDVDKAFSSVATDLGSL